MNFLVKLSDGFMGMFQAGADTFVGFLTTIVPLLISLILFVNALIKIIGEKRVFGFMQRCTKFTLLRYTLIPFLACFFLTNPMCYTFGRFLKEEHKAAHTFSLQHKVFYYLIIFSNKITKSVENIMVLDRRNLELSRT